MEADDSAGTVHLVAWGFWSVEVAVSFSPTLQDACLQPPRAKRVAMDARELKPMRDEGQAGFGQFVAALGVLGIERVTIVTASHLTKLQLLRIAKERDPNNLVKFIEA